VGASCSSCHQSDTTLGCAEQFRFGGPGNGISHVFNIPYRLFALILGPNAKNTNGIPTIATLMKPNKLVAQPIPRRWYIWKVKRGKASKEQVSVN